MKTKTGPLYLREPRWIKHFGQLRVTEGAFAALRACGAPEPESRAYFASGSTRSFAESTCSINSRRAGTGSGFPQPSAALPTVLNTHQTFFHSLGGWISTRHSAKGFGMG